VIAADRAEQRPAQARLLVVDEHGGIEHAARAKLAQFLRPGDLLVANDAATLPASLHGVHARSGRSIELRLAGRESLRVDAATRFTAVLMGEGDWRLDTNARPAPPTVEPGDALAFPGLRARVLRVVAARIVEVDFECAADVLWAALARHGRPVQYAHLREPLALWDVWTPFAGAPLAFEPPSAGFAIDWALLRVLRERGIGFATLTHAAGLSATGDAALDARLPLDEPYRIPASTALAIQRARDSGARVVAVGTTVVRALEHSAAVHGRAVAGEGLATQRIGALTRLRVVDALLSGTHEPGTSHHALLRAFVDERTLARVDDALERHAYRTHEFGDSVLMHRGGRATPLTHSAERQAASA